MHNWWWFFVLHTYKPLRNVQIALHLIICKKVNIWHQILFIIYNKWNLRFLAKCYKERVYKCITFQMAQNRIQIKTRHFIVGKTWRVHLQSVHSQKSSDDVMRVSIWIFNEWGTETQGTILDSFQYKQHSDYIPSCLCTYCRMSSFFQVMFCAVLCRVKI